MANVKSDRDALQFKIDDKINVTAVAAKEVIVVKDSLTNAQQQIEALREENSRASLHCKELEKEVTELTTARDLAVTSCSIATANTIEAEKKLVDKDLILSQVCWFDRRHQYVVKLLHLTLVLLCICFLVFEANRWNVN